VTRAEVYGYNARDGAGIVQCLRCSLVYEPTDWRPRECGYCGLAYGESLHDPCIGYIPGVFAACCGHGIPEKRYGVPPDWPMKLGPLNGG
jgi:hypothetical protein